MKVRPAALSDAPRIAALIMSYLSLLTVDPDGRGAERFFELVSEPAVVNRCSRVVRPAARRQGIGRALLAAAEEWGRAQGCAEFASDAQPDNDVSSSAHRALGFADVGLVRCFAKES